MNKISVPKRIRNHVNPLSITHKNDLEDFENKNDVIIDIGSYRGEFGERLLEKFGDKKNFIFFEIRTPFYDYLKKIFKDKGNVRVYNGDAGNSIKEMILDLHKNGNKIDKIFINFPDPWFKKKHRKRRFLNEKTLNIFQEVLDEDEEIIFQTDQKQLFKDTIELIKENKSFKIYKFKKSLFGIKTYWEEMKEKEGNKIYRLKILKRKKNKFFNKLFKL